MPPARVERGEAFVLRVQCGHDSAYPALLLPVNTPERSPRAEERAAGTSCAAPRAPHVGQYASASCLQLPKAYEYGSAKLENFQIRLKPIS